MPRGTLLFQRREVTLGKYGGGGGLSPGTLYLPKEQKCLAAITTGYLPHIEG
jgi:hypothetical protein